MTISKNVTILNIEIVNNIRYCPMFKLVDPCQKVIIDHCNIITAIENGESNFQFYKKKNSTELLIANINFSGRKTTNTFSTTHGKSDRVHRNSDQPLPPVITIIDRCSFVNLNSYYNGATQLFVNIFKESIVEINSLTFNNVYSLKSFFSNNNFTNSSLSIRNGYSSIEHCNFKGNTNRDDNKDDNYYLFQLNIGDSESYGIASEITYCTFEKAIYGAVNLQRRETTLKNNQFIDNTIIIKPFMPSGRAAGVTSNGGSLDILNCHFINNSAPINQPGAIYSQNHNGCQRPCLTFSIENTIIIVGHYPGSSETTVIDSYPLTVTARMKVGKGFKIQCNPNEFMHQRSFPDHYFKFYCKKCDGTQYNANFAGYKDNRPYNVTCYDCPYQASCVNGIKSKGNYWGISDPKSGKVRFTLCPASYCCRSLKTCTSYNTCNDKRKGRLCGDCQKDYAISLLSENDCVPKMQCQKQALLWSMYLVVAMLACLFVMYGGDVWQLVSLLLMYIKNRSQRGFLSTVGDERQHQEQQQQNPGELEQEEQQEDQEQEEQQEEEQEELVDNETNLPPNGNISSNFTALVKITFFFYQTASIIRVQASAKTAYNISGFIGYITSFFNIKIDVTKGAVTLCPFNTSSVIIVEAFRSSVPLVSLSMIICAIGIFKALTKLKNHSSFRSATNEIDDSTTERLLQQNPPTDYSTTKKNFLCRLKGAYVNLMLLGYSTVAVFAFQSIHCISLGEGDENTYLFLQASVQCYQHWQVLMIIVITLWIAPFPFVLYTGCRNLHSRHVSPNQFIMIISFPPTCPLLVWGVHRRLDLGERRDREREHILSVLNDPFRREKKNAGDILIWEHVLIGRRLVLMLTTTFILSPILRLYPVGLLLIMFTTHDHVMKPFTSNRMNLLQFISTLVLILLVMVNMFWALTNDVDLMKNQKYFILGEFFIYLESILLISPLIIPIGFLIFKMVKYFIGKYS